MVLRLRAGDEENIVLPKSVLKRLSLEEGDRVKIKVDRTNRLILQREAERLAALRRFRGIWKDEDVDAIFQKIDEEWDEWNERWHA